MTPVRNVVGIDPRSGRPVGEGRPVADPAAVDAVAEAAWRAHLRSHDVPSDARAAFLRAIADRLTAAAERLVAVATLETGLPEARLRGEVGRTTGQLRLFADVIADDAWRTPRIDLGDAERRPLPKPDVRSLRRPLGPVVVFGASNFPFAFSTAGGDTAAALAAGCPVIVKAHPGHPATSAAVGACILEAAAETGMPEGTFAQVFDDGHEVGARLVAHPRVRAVAFTGSRAGGLALARVAADREVPVPVFAEMGSINPVVILPEAARLRSRSLAEGLHGSFTLGVGQFCTNPGVVFVPHGAGGDAVREALVPLVAGTPAGVMLNERVCAGYGAGVATLEALGAHEIARGQGAGSDVFAPGVARVFEVGLDAVGERPELLAEVFGPVTLLVRYGTVEALTEVAWRLEGQLTATVHAEAGEIDLYPELVHALEDRTGRLVFDQWPTGVEVGPAMVHGGPYPATSDGRSTSVGTHAIDRFTRLVAYQNAPSSVLPTPLR